MLVLFWPISSTTLEKTGSKIRVCDLSFRLRTEIGFE